MSREYAIKRKEPAITARFGAYGYEVHGVGPGSGLVVLPREAVQSVELLQQTDQGGSPARSMGPEEATLVIPRGGYARLVRASRRAVFHVPEPLSPAELVHPCLGAVCSIFSHWDGRLGFHAGSFVEKGRAWGVLGGNEAGKSTLLGAMAARGIQILADDFVTLSGARVWAGPRSIDLREEAVEHLSLSAHVEPSRGGTRWRLPLREVPSTAPLGGWFFLGWDEDVQMLRLEAKERMEQLPRYRPVQDPPDDLRSLLDMAGLPAWRALRPRRWDVIDDVIDAMIGVIRVSV